MSLTIIPGMIQWNFPTDEKVNADEWYVLNIHTEPHVICKENFYSKYYENGD